MLLIHKLSTLSYKIKLNHEPKKKSVKVLSSCNSVKKIYLNKLHTRRKDHII